MTKTLLESASRGWLLKRYKLNLNDAREPLHRSYLISITFCSAVNYAMIAKVTTRCRVCKLPRRRFCAFACLADLSTFHSILTSFHLHEQVSGNGSRQQTSEMFIFCYTDIFEDRVMQIDVHLE